MCRPQHCRETLDQFSLTGRAHQVKVWTWDEKKTLELYELAPR